MTRIQTVTPMTTAGAAETTPPGGALGKDEFLRLLVTQLRHQDPFEPMDSQAMIAQLAQFSALEQMQNVAESVSLGRQEQGLMQGLLLQGKSVSALTEDGRSIVGPVTRVAWDAVDGLALEIGGVFHPLRTLTNVQIVMESGSQGEP